MSVGRIQALLLSACVWLAVGMGSAAACSCPWVLEEENLPREDFAKRRFEQATDVVRGQIVDLRAGETVLRQGHRIVVAKMKITSTVKGDIPPGEATILTMFGVGDCGIAASLLTAIAWQRDAILEVRKLPELPGEYMVDMCGYGRIVSMRE